ncbi:type V CRISPR-associated protein Cas4 [Candidatus Daviesbacteria bacterium RIFCSPLOWO2_02_FULL_38_15]|uniref:Type V CRISPR-associated protein Cas4 n=1 Tax=Candidatus Daviesbacteria bacterium RIFCSPLOWO2_02_FULL_38_15 TaxID=1797794 RepID=A0A1F5N4G6_9BACT|nr:MAG: type V CRISPR-associated protein Cas4 [Candidatus Daviesbacteria bacterium RIFCSPLOWO2_02_FULL_38_15]
MDSAIPISAINDFLFCPKSLYLHSVYSSFDTSIYHDIPQTLGSITHENIEDQSYTTSKHILQGLSVYNVKLGIKGKIDAYDAKNKFLIERKYRVKQIYEGFRYQLYAQMYCLEEAGFKVRKLFLQSLSDNKRYEISLPTESQKKEFEDVLAKMKAFNGLSVQNHSCRHCADNIYDLLNW